MHALYISVLQLTLSKLIQTCFFEDFVNWKMKLLLCFMMTVFVTGISAIKEIHAIEEVDAVHPSHHLAHELCEEQA